MFSRLWWRQLWIVGEQRIKQTYRRPLLTLVLIFLPVLVLSPMTLLRWNMHREFWPACHYRSVALPSAGTARFLQSFMCGFDLHCHDESKREIDPTAYYDRAIVPQWWNALLPALTNRTKVWTLASAIADLQLFLTIPDKLQLTPNNEDADDADDRRRIETLKLNVSSWLDETLERARALASGRALIGAPPARFGSKENQSFDIELVAQKADQLFRSVSQTVKQMSASRKLRDQQTLLQDESKQFSNGELGFLNTILNNAERYFQKVNKNIEESNNGTDMRHANSTHFRSFVHAAVKSLAQHGLLDIDSVDTFFAKIDDSWLLLQNVSLTSIAFARQSVQRYQHIIDRMQPRSSSDVMHVFMKNAMCGENLDHYLPRSLPTVDVLPPTAEFLPVSSNDTTTIDPPHEIFAVINETEAKRQRREVGEFTVLQNQTREPLLEPNKPIQPSRAPVVHENFTMSVIETLARTRLDAPVIKTLFKLIVGKENDSQFFAKSLSKIEASLERAMNRSSNWSLSATHVCPLFEHEVNKILKTNVLMSMIKPLAYGKILYYYSGESGNNTKLSELADEIIQRTYSKFRPISISFGYIIQLFNFVANVGRAREHYLSPQTDRVLTKLIAKALQQSSAVSSIVGNRKNSSKTERPKTDETSSSVFTQLLPILMFPELTQQLSQLARAILRLQHIILTECLSWQSNIERASSLEQFGRRARELEDSKKLLGGVVFRAPSTNSDEKTIRYEIHMHSSRMSDTRRAEPELDVMRGGMPPLYYMRYLLGFVPLQDAIDRSIIETLSDERSRKSEDLSSRMLWWPAAVSDDNSTTNFTWLEETSPSSTETQQQLTKDRDALPMLFAHKMPVPCFTMDYLVMVLLALKPFLIIVAICIGSGIMAYELVSERERDTDRMMRLHGIRLGVRSTVWFVRWLIIWTLVAILIVLYEYYGDLIIYSNHWLQFIFLLSTLVANMTFTFMISSFTDRPLVASIICMAWIFFSGIPGKYLGVIELRLPDAGLVPYMLIHMITGCFLIVYTMFMEQLMTGITFENWARGMQMYGTYTPRELFYFVLIDMALYFVTGVAVRVFRECGRRRLFCRGGREATSKNVFAFAHYDNKQRTVNIQKNAIDSIRDVGGSATVEAGNRTANRNNVVELDHVTKIYDPTRRCLDLFSWLSLGKSQKVHPQQKSSAAEELAEISTEASPDLPTGYYGIHDVNATLHDNEITCFLGHNGAGKSTAMAIMCGFDQPSAGNVRIFGHDNIYDEKVRSLIGYCPQSNIIFSQMTVREHLKLYVGLKKGLSGKKTDDYVIDAMQRTELLPFADQYAETLSGGYKRRLMLAIAFACGNRLIVLDEPSSGVDPAARRQFWHMIVRQRRPGCVIVISTHHLNEAHYLADKLAIMHQGRLIAFDPLNKIIERYSAGDLAFCQRPHLMIGNGELEDEDAYKNKPTWRIALSWEILPFLSDVDTSQQPRPNNELDREDEEDPIAQRNLLQEHVRFSLSALVSNIFPSAFLLPPQFSADQQSNNGAASLQRIGLPIKLLRSSHVSSSTDSCVIVDECVYEMREFFCVTKKRQLLEQLLALQQQQNDDRQQFNFIDIDIEPPSLHDLLLDLNQVEPHSSSLVSRPNSSFYQRQTSSAVNGRRPHAKTSQRMISVDSIGAASEIITPTAISDQRNQHHRSASTKILLGLTRYAPTRPLRQLIGLIWKRFVHHIRDYQFTLAVLVVPLLSILATALFLTSVRKPLGNEDNKLELDPNQLYWGFPVFHALQPNTGAEGQNTTYGQDIVNLLLHDPSLNRIDPKLCFRCNEANNREKRRIYADLARKGTYKSYANLNSCLPDEDVTLPNSTTYVVDNATGIPLVHVDVSEVYGNEDVRYIRPRNSVIKKIFGGYSFRRNLPILTTPSIESSSPPSPAVTVWYNIRGEHSLPQYLSQLNNALLKSHMGDSRWHIRAYAVPLNFTRDEQASEDNTQVTLVASALLVITFAATLLPTSTVVYVIRERLRGERRVQLLSSVTHSTYWIASFLFDLLVLHVLLIGGIAIIFIAIQNSVYSYDDGYYHTILLLLFVYSASTIAMAYLLSLLFSEPNFAFTVLAALACSFGFVAAMFVNPSNFFSWLANIENLIKVEDDRVFMWLPNYCLAQSLINVQSAKFRAHSLKQFVCDKLSFGAAEPVVAYNNSLGIFGNQSATRSQEEQWSDECARSLIINPLAWTVTGRYLAAMAISGAIYFLILLCVEYGREYAGAAIGVVKWRLSRSSVDTQQQNSAANGIVAELRHVSYTYSANKYVRQLITTLANRLFKQRQRKSHQVGALQAYGSPVVLAQSNADESLAPASAVNNTLDATRDGIRNVSLTVKAGECYGLFGFNGAGKTTIFRCLTNEIIPCAGTIRYSFKNYRSDSARLTGYCPQTDPLDPGCTPEETLAFYAVMKNFRHADIWPNVENCMEEFALQAHAHKCCAHLSGGNKRKLSAAIALLKRPQLILMDEATSGVDPAAQQLLGRALQSAMSDPDSKCAVLLTSHKMADATLLCSRLAIVRRGHLLMEDAMSTVVEKFARKFLVLEVYYNKNDGDDDSRGRALPLQQTSFCLSGEANRESDEAAMPNRNLLRIEDLVQRLEVVGLRAIPRRVSDRVLELVILNDATGSVEDGDRVKVYTALVGGTAASSKDNELSGDECADEPQTAEWRKNLYDFEVKNSSIEEVFSSLSHPLPDARADMLLNGSSNC